MIPVFKTALNLVRLFDEILVFFPLLFFFFEFLFFVLVCVTNRYAVVCGVNFIVFVDLASCRTVQTLDVATLADFVAIDDSLFFVSDSSKVFFVDFACRRKPIAGVVFRACFIIIIIIFNYLFIYLFLVLRVY